MSHPPFGLLGRQTRANATKLDPDVATLVQDNNEFAWSLYHQIAEHDRNLFISPYSICSVLAMTYSGAGGNTAAEMKSALRFSLAADQLPRAFGKLIAHFDGDGKARPFQLRVANRLWGQKDYGFIPEFIKISEEHYRAGFEELDFANSADAARMRINAWVEQRTEHKIDNLIPPGLLDGLTVLVLTNAIYFKAAWLEPFHSFATEVAPFYLSDGSTIDAPMMCAEQSLLFASHESFLMLQLPYEGQAQSMIILLPRKKDGLRDLEKQLSAEALSNWLRSLSTHEVDVKLPKFKVSAAIELSGTLEQMGMKEAFAPKADFSGIATRGGLFISAIIHKAFVDVNEAGTEAAAATAVVCGRGLPPMPVPFHADHPFLYLIRDNATGAVLFLGRLANPIG